MAELLEVLRSLADETRYKLIKLFYNMIIVSVLWRKIKHL